MSLDAMLRRDQRGFSLIEIMVAVGLIGILLALAGPRIWSAVNKVHKHKGVSDVQAISDAFEQYLAENGSYPGGTDAQVQATLSSDYLEQDFTFGNAFDQSYIYLLASSNRSYMVIDLNNDTTDDDAGTAGQQVDIACGGQTVTVTVSDGDTSTPANLTLDNTLTPAELAACTMQADWHWARS